MRLFPDWSDAKPSVSAAVIHPAEQAVIKDLDLGGDAEGMTAEQLSKKVPFFAKTDSTIDAAGMGWILKLDPGGTVRGKRLRAKWVKAFSWDVPPKLGSVVVARLIRADQYEFIVRHQERFRAEILTNETGGAYTFSERSTNGTGTWTAGAGARTGTAYEDNVNDAVPVGSIVWVSQVLTSAGGLAYTFPFRTGTTLYYFDGACVVDAASAGTASGSLESMTVTADTTAAGPPASATAVSSAKWLLLHLNVPITGPAVLSVPMTYIGDFTLTALGGAPAKARVRLGLTRAGITQDFCYADDGSVTPERNDWTNKPTTEALAVPTIELKDDIDTLHDDPSAAYLTGGGPTGEKLVGTVVEVPNGSTYYGVAIYVASWLEERSNWQPTAACSATIAVNTALSSGRTT